MTTFTTFELLRLVLVLLGIGAISGIPIGIWVAHLPTPAPPPSDVELGQLADDLERAAALIRARAAE